MNIPFLLVIPLKLHEDPICRHSISLFLASTKWPTLEFRRKISKRLFRAIVVFCTILYHIFTIFHPSDAKKNAALTAPPQRVLKKTAMALRHYHPAGSSRPGGPRLQSLRRGRADARSGRRARGVRRDMALIWGKSWENHGKIMGKWGQLS